MRQLILATTLGLSALGAAVQAEPIKVPVDSDEKGSVYVAPNVNPTETSATVKGGTVGVLRPDGSGTYIGTDTSMPRPTYSLGGSTGGNLSLSGGVQSDGKSNNGVKAGVTIKY